MPNRRRRLVFHVVSRIVDAVDDMDFMDDPSKTDEARPRVWPMALK